ncbi:MAG TPA: VanZ family protein [Chitinophagaceae bacterium]|nr:VanZ family protein [Chitinophagaceae bacterium]
MFLRTIKFSFVFAVGWLILITLLLCIPGTRLPKLQWHDRIFLDKWIHIFLFLVLVFLWCRAYPVKARKIFLIITIVCILYGVVMELVQQYFIPFRSFDLRDMIANSIGAAAGYFVSAKRLITNR